MFISHRGPIAKTDQNFGKKWILFAEASPPYVTNTLCWGANLLGKMTLRAYEVLKESQ